MPIRRSRSLRNIRVAADNALKSTGKGVESTAHWAAKDHTGSQEFLMQVNKLAESERQFLVDVATTEFETRRIMRQIDYDYYFDTTGRKPLLLIRLFDWIVDGLACAGMFLLALILPFFTLIFWMLFRITVIILCYAVVICAIYLYFKS